MEEIIKTYFLEEKKKDNETKIGIKKEKYVEKYDLNIKIYNKSNNKTFVLKNMTKREVDLFEGELYRTILFYEIL